MRMTREEFRNSVIAQDDDEDYSESGWVACVHNGTAYMGRYGHCSCYGTFDDLCGGGIGDYYDEGSPSFTWSGTPDEMVELAKSNADPDMPNRTANEEDYDYDHLKAVYQEIIAWDKNGRK